MKPLPSRDELLAYFKYDADSGALYRIRVGRWGSEISPKLVSSFHGTARYGVVEIRGERYQRSRVIWKMMTGEEPEQIDHINRNVLDERWCNLRASTKKENLRNKSVYKNNKSGFKGVSWHGQVNKWRADITVNGKTKFLGLFDTPDQAFMERCVAAVKLHGAFASTGHGGKPVPKKMEKALEKEAVIKGLTGERKDAYVWGTMNKLGMLRHGKKMTHEGMKGGKK